MFCFHLHTLVSDTIKSNKNAIRSKVSNEWMDIEERRNVNRPQTKATIIKNLLFVVKKRVKYVAMHPHREFSKKRQNTITKPTNFSHSQSLAGFTVIFFRRSKWKLECIGRTIWAWMTMCLALIIGHCHHHTIICHNLPRLICLVLRLWRQHPITSMLINTNDVPDAMPTISNVPDIAGVGVVLVVGGTPSDDAGSPFGGESIFQFSDFITPMHGFGHSIHLFYCHIILREKKVFFFVYRNFGLFDLRCDYFIGLSGKKVVVVTVSIHFILIYPIFIESHFIFNCWNVYLYCVCEDLCKKNVRLFGDLCVEINIDRWLTVQQPRWQQQE